MHITKDALIQEVLSAHPETREVFIGLGMCCLDCFGAGLETVETGARMHGLEVETVLRALNASIEAPEPRGRQE